MDINTETDGTSGTAVSIFGQAQGMNDFPVLKAFQEYIDAEQAKARKRMLGLSVFFIVLLAIIVVTFTLIVIGVINRNQSLSDRLLEFALQRQQQPVVQQPIAPQPVVVQQPVPAPVQPTRQTDELKPVLDKIERLASALEQRPHQVPQVQPPRAAEQNPQQQNAVNAQIEAERLREQLKREREKIEEERKKLKEEQHKAEVERYRRKMYADYYAKKDAEEKRRQAPSSPSQPQVSGTKLDSMKPVGYFNRQTAEEDAELAEIARQSKRKAQAEVAKSKAEAEAAEAATRKAQSEAARRKAEAEAAEADRRKAAAEAAARKVEADAAESKRMKIEAVDAKRRMEEADVAAEKRRKEEAAAAAAKAKEMARREQSELKTETINVGARDGGVPWIIQRLEEQ